MTWTACSPSKVTSGKPLLTWVRPDVWCCSTQPHRKSTQEMCRAKLWKEQLLEVHGFLRKLSCPLQSVFMKALGGILSCEPWWKQFGRRWGRVVQFFLSSWSDVVPEGQLFLSEQGAACSRPRDTKENTWCCSMAPRFLLLLQEKKKL